MTPVDLDVGGITQQLAEISSDVAECAARLQGAHVGIRELLENAQAKILHVIEDIRNAEKKTAEASSDQPACDESDPTETKPTRGKLYDLETLNPDTWQELGSGHFGTVYRAFVQGTEVALKLLNEENEQAILKEYHQLKDLRHDNIVAIRDLGTMEGNIPWLGLDKEISFLMMEYVGVNLATYVTRQEERTPRLPRSRTWDVTRQVVSALNYLHTLADPIAHCDLKPDNVLIDEHVMYLRVKLVDFGISQKRGNLCEDVQLTRWSAPEFASDENPSDGDPMMPYIKGDIWAVGLLINFMQTGLEPYGSMTDNKVQEEAFEVALELYRQLSQSSEPPSDVLLQIQKQCLQPEREARPMARELLDAFFKDGRNPYLSEKKKADFFTFGFLKDTMIFVADSVISNVTEGESAHAPTFGYRPRYLKCVIDKQVLDGPTTEYDEEAYRTRRQAYKTMVKANKIFDGNMFALASLITSRCGTMETHIIALRLKETKYVHHRVMREMWMSLDERDKLKQVPCKMQVHPFYSTSLGVHIAVLTNESRGKKKFIFTRRSNRTGMATPSMWTCGAVETLSLNDVTTKLKGRKKKEVRMVQLLRTASRGLEEELNIVLTSDELHAINLHTVYLKFDTHEWGVCGFVDLGDTRIKPQHQFSFAQVRAGFTSGAKDKFEHEEVVGIDYDVDSMVTFVRQHAASFASSTKLVVVKTLQAHFPMVRLLSEFDAGEEEALTLQCRKGGDGGGGDGVAGGGGGGDGGAGGDGGGSGDGGDGGVRAVGS